MIGAGGAPAAPKPLTGLPNSSNRLRFVLRCGRVRGSNRVDASYNSSYLLASIASKFNGVTNQRIKFCALKWNAVIASNCIEEIICLAFAHTKSCCNCVLLDCFMGNFTTDARLD